MSVAVIDQIGGEDGVRKLVERFYDLVEARPEGAGLRELHSNGHGLSHARVEQFNFMCGFLGGRRHYLEKHGHLNVRLMHAHVAIPPIEAQNWLKLMDEAMADVAISGDVAAQMYQAFERVALALVNQPE